DLRSVGGKVTSLVPSLHACLERDPVGRRTGPAALRMPRRATAELKDGIVTEDLHQGRHVPDVDAAGRGGPHRWQRRPFLVEVDAPGPVGSDGIVTKQVHHAEGRLPVALKLADHGPGMQVVTTG